MFLFLFLFFIKKVNIRCIRRLSLFAYLALDIKKEKMFKKRRKVVISIAHNNKNVRIFSYLVKNSWEINACRFETSLRVRVIKPKFNGDESIMRSAYTNEIPGTLSPFSHFPSTPRPSIVSQSYNAAILESVPSPPPPLQSLSPLLNIRARIKYSFTYKFCIQKQTVRLVLFMTFILPRRTSTREKKKATFYARNRFLFTRRNSFATRDSPSFFIHASVEFSLNV